MDYTIDITTMCSDSNQRSEVEKDLLSFAHSLKVSKNDLTNESQEEIVEIGWSGTGDFEPIKKKLLKLAGKYDLCFEIDYNTEDVSSGTIFIGVGAINAETEYLLQELRKLLPRLIRRAPNLAEKLNIPEKEINRSLTTFIRKKSNDE